jgi:hypothetical protein
MRTAKTQVSAQPKHRASDDARRLRDIVEAIRAEAIKATVRDSRPYPANPRDRKGRGAIGEADDLLGQS